MFNATFNNISVLLVEETGIPGEIHRPVTSLWQIVLLNVVSSTTHHKRDSNSQKGPGGSMS
jgi:hypothetical protein